MTVAALPVQEPDEPEQLPVTAPVNGPLKPVAVKTPVDGTKDKAVEVTVNGRLPVFAETNVGYHEADEIALLVIAELVAFVAVVAVPALPAEPLTLPVIVLLNVLTP